VIQIGPDLGISLLIGDAGSGDKSTRTHREVHDKQQCDSNQWYCRVSTSDHGSPREPNTDEV